MKLPVYTSGVGYQLIYPGARLTKEQAQRYGDRNMPRYLRRVGFKTHVFEADPDIHGGHYFRIGYGKDC